MTDCEAEEVTSSTDVALPSSDDVTSSQETPLGDSIASANVILQQCGDGMAEFSADQQSVTMSVMEGLGGHDEGYTIVSPEQALEDGGGHVILTTDGMVSADGQLTMAHTASLQSLLAGQGGTSQLMTANGDTIQIITVGNPTDLQNKNVWQMVPDMSNAEIGAIIINPPADGQHEPDGSEESMDTGEAANNTQVVDMVPVSSMPGAVAEMLMPPPASHPLPLGCPAWAARLKDCQKIGDAFRGWVESEVELDLLLTYHKQQTGSFWGTRQSPSPAKQSTRLMWKSQYVPFDGIPFINSGSRAIVMECQYGPRRKGAQAKRTPNENLGPTEFKQTCPARIYIKKVRKFPSFEVDMNLDKKTLKMAMDKSFQMLKERGIEACGQERFYVQLPTEASHEFHGELNDVTESDTPRRLHPCVAQKIRDVVAGGESRLYAVRKALRRFVERELFESPEIVPEKHNLTFYPTVNDLQNHIHQALRDICSGLFPTTVEHIRVEGMAYSGSSDENSQDLQKADFGDPTVGDGSPHAETVTVTLTQHPGEDGQHVISRVETHLSDGTTQVSTELTQETAQLLAKLHPNMFPAGSLLQLQEAADSPEPQQLTPADSKVQTVTLMTRQSEAESRLNDSPLQTVTPTLVRHASGAMATLQIVQGEDEQQADQLQMPQSLQGLQSLQLLDGSVLNQQAVQQLVQQAGGLPAGLQFINANGELSDAHGNPLHILSAGEDGPGISFVQEVGTPDAGDSEDEEDGGIPQEIQDVANGLGGQGVITIAMAPQIIKEEEEREDCEVVDAESTDEPCSLATALL